MPTMVKIQKVTIGSTPGSITFSSIPQTYTDLVIKVSSKDNSTGNALGNYYAISFNGSTSVVAKYIQGTGTATGTDILAQLAGVSVSGGGTANNFSNDEIYINNYTSSNSKFYYVQSVNENNTTGSYITWTGGVWSNSAAITSITLTANGASFTQYTTATLYGISNNNDYASGGNRIYTDGTYWYHQFLATGTTTFTPLRSLTVDYLVVGGGGGGGSRHAGGGGAGGYRTGSLSLNPSTNYTVTVGAGGSGATNNNGGAPNGATNGGDSVFATITASGGGYGAGNGYSGNSGGSGGGSSTTNYNAPGNTPSTSPSQGNNGGWGGGTYSSGGGGGAGAVGSNFPSNNVGGNGGAGVASSITGSSVTYAGGGGGGTWVSGTAGSGGAGGGGAGSSTGNKGTAGTANTGGGGGGGGTDSAPNAGGGNGGSGIVVIRYPV
jgi:hypothetical protein